MRYAKRLQIDEVYRASLSGLSHSEWQDLFKFPAYMQYIYSAPEIYKTGQAFIDATRWYWQNEDLYKLGIVSGGGSDSSIDEEEVRVNLSPEIKVKILEGQRVAGSNKLIGGHSSSINNSNPNYAVQEIKVNSDGTKVVKFTTQYIDGNLSKIKTSTLFPDSWSDEDIINSINKIGNTPAVGIRSSEGLTLHRGTINGVEIEVIRNGNDIISGFPVGGKPTTNFDLIP